MTAVHLTISGRVQGVGYRNWTQQEAMRLGLSGWVRNRHDGSVEAQISGPEEMIEQLLSACRQGPPAAEVINIQVTDSEPLTTVGFEVLASA